MNEKTTAVPHAPAEAGRGAPGAAGLTGSIGTFRLFALVMAFVSPLVTVAGWLVILIAYGGPAAPALMLVAAVLVLVFSLGFVAMGHHMPNPGAFYSYVTAGLGRVVGLGAGFVAVVVYVLLGLSSFIFFGVAASRLVGELHGPEISWYLYTLLLLVIVGIFGYLEVEVSARVLLVAMGLEVLIVLIFDLAIFAAGRVSDTGGVTLQPFSWDSLSGASWGLGLLFAILFFNGFEGTAAFREEVKNPTRTVGRATLLVVAFVGIFYCIASWAIVSYFGPDQSVELASSDPVSMFPTALAASVGKWMVDIASVLLLTSIFAASVSIYSILTRYIYSFGVDGVLPRRLGAVHPKHKSPYFASFVAGALFLVGVLPFVMAGADPSVLYGQLGGTGGYGYLLLFALVSLAIVSYFWRQRASHSVNVGVSLVAPAVSFVAMAALLVLGIMNFTELTGGIGALAVILQATVWGAGLVGVVLALYFRARRPQVYERIGRQGPSEAAESRSTAPSGASQR